MRDLLGRSLGVLGRHARPLVLLTLLIYLPYVVLYKAAAGLGWLTEEAADALFGLVDLFLTPLANAAVIFLIHQWATGGKPTLATAFSTARKSWSRLLAAYVSISFILLGWLAVLAVPGFLAMKFLAIGEPMMLVPFGVLALGYVMSNYAFLDPLVVLEGLRPYEARHRSVALVKGHRRVVLFFGLIAVAPPMALETAADQIGKWASATYGWPGPVVSGTLALLAALLNLWPTVLFYLYYRDLIQQRAAASLDASRST